MLATDRPKEAAASFQAAMNRCRRGREPEWRAARSASGLGEALYRQGRFGEAEPYLVDSYRILAVDPNAEEGPRVAAHERVVSFYTERAQHDRLQMVTGATHTQASSTATRMDRL